MTRPDRATTPTLGYRLAFLEHAPLAALSGDPVLLCDPLTGLVSYPSFEDHLRRNLTALVGLGVHLAIGDVDDLTAHVTACLSSDPTSFGHLAGNECMRIVGGLTLRWAQEWLADCHFSLCATFGGDEVIVVAAGTTYELFTTAIGALADLLRTTAPRPCSFATATVGPGGLTANEPHLLYRTLVASVDMALFQLKRDLRARGLAPCGHRVDLGQLSIPQTAREIS